MLNTLKTRKKEQGFTIIEVLIVLAIAGLILLIVFLAVPALQRNARNTTLKSDASATAAAVSDYAGQYNGSNPKGLKQNGSTAGSWLMTDGANPVVNSTSFKTNGSTLVNGAVATVAGTPVYTTGQASPTQTKIDYGQVMVVFGEDCTPALNSRATAVFYVTEPAVSGTTPATCVQS